MTRWNGPVVATIDMLMSLMVVFLVLAAPTPKLQAATDIPICRMAIDAKWTVGVNDDVDLWVKGPIGAPVGYSAKNGPMFDLVRDDLGMNIPGDEENSERACARVIPDGEYIVNLHLYRSSTMPPLSVSVSVAIVDPSKATMETIFTEQVELKTRGEQLTVVRFKIKDGQLVTGSENDLPIKLREKQ